MDEKKTKILFVDDDEVLRIYFRDIFWIHGLENKYEFETVDSLEKANEIIKNPKTRPNILFLDLLMPQVINGRLILSPEGSFNLLKKIKTDPELKNIKVIIFSGYSEKIFIDEAKKLGAENYLIKGDNLPKEIIEFVEKISKKK
ncbi:MAG: response regulator [Parcubacteria group bacterium]|nr:response regulator [Parcubacteria group bacterium]